MRLVWQVSSMEGTWCFGNAHTANILDQLETRKRYVVKHNLITEVYLMTVMETTTCFGLYWPIIRLSRELKG